VTLGTFLLVPICFVNNAKDCNFVINYQYCVVEHGQGSFSLAALTTAVFYNSIKTNNKTI
jgi:hypothetical protein